MMAVIKDYYNGPTHIRIHDDAITHDPEEIERIHRETSRIIISALVAQEMKKREMETDKE